ncbi:bifunctional sugar phosphate isomerase/epimerase/4-hydroxyphenylpyruvate dioxygenase family protein [Trinickia dinghuensis]|uniref:3-dehydroshikimate dehydratase n=1 Tax=Trinickia dinghuensis TaxID=2291023 RepID=A0A3D8JTC6_9BURK|nr:sugar phosphate isomerase/epimerase and 4-hydroxyphenylpyruvate domain-containing protein [Trinickia dinghuensis]RDU95916.1 sugar phosphate isomerase/epimerase and 4-hydroxyphenylpyruvate domain-containing protein [Trinickia dinghuensis]
MRRSIATVSISGTLVEKLRAIQAAGFGCVEIFENDLLYYDGTPGDVRRICDDLGLRIALYQPFRDFEGVGAERLERNVERLKRKFDVMHALGTDRLLVCSSVSPDTIRDDELIADQLAVLARHAQAAGVTACYEALAWGRHVHSYRHAWRLVDTVDHPSLTLALDSFHTLSLGDPVDEIASIPGDRIGFVQIADAPRMDMDVLEWSRHYRCFPGQGDFDLAGFTARVVKSGYRGPLSLEVFNDGFRSAPPAATAADGYRSLLLLEEQTRPRLTGASDTDALPLYAPPAVPAHLSTQFLEFAVDAASREHLVEWLEKLRFRRAGRHRSKDVTLYRHGMAAIVLNAEPDSFASAFFQQHGLSLCASAFRLDDAGLALERAAGFGYVPFSGRVGPNERVVPAVRSPDGSINYLVNETSGQPTLFEADFVLTDIDGPNEVGPLTGIDHICLALPMGGLDSWTLFLKAVFGLDASPGVLVPDPYGLVRSRAFSNRDRSLRVVLNASVDPHTAVAETVHVYHGTGLNHVAFSTDDIFGAVAEFKSAGLPLLHIPRNYYDDLEARYALPESLLARLQEHGLLYDRDERGGEFLHAYTETLDRRFFLEIVERRGGYDGYGAPNAAVRLASQARRRRDNAAA